MHYITSLKHASQTSFPLVFTARLLTMADKQVTHFWCFLGPSRIGALGCESDDPLPRYGLSHTQIAIGSGCCLLPPHWATRVAEMTIALARRQCNDIKTWKRYTKQGKISGQAIGEDRKGNNSEASGAERRRSVSASGRY